MNNSRGIESIFIGTLIIATLVLGVIMNLSYEKITISSICFAISITSLVYWFLGGIEGAGFDTGWLKLGGSIAALLGSFYIINQELRMDSNYHFDPVSIACAVFDKASGEPKSLHLKNGNSSIDSITSISNKSWKNHRLTLIGDSLYVKKNDFYLGRLNKQELNKNNFFSKIADFDKEAQYFTMHVGDTEESELLGIKIEAQKFQENGSFLFKIQIVNSKESKIETVKNKQIKIIKVGEGNNYFIVAGLQSNFTDETNDEGKKVEKYFQLSIRPLKLS